MSTNSDRFITAFNRIDHTLREIADVREFMPFYRLIERARRKNPLVQKYEDDLRAYADLRNAIVHHRTAIEFVIAEPHIQIVEEIEAIDAALAKPKLVGELFRKRVMVFQTTDSLTYMLKIIRRHKYTQFPVYMGQQFQGLITTVGITNWLATSMGKGNWSNRVTLQDILLHEKKSKNYKFISRSMTIYEAEEIFKQGVERGQRYEALLITEHGRPHHKLIGMVTPIDIMKVD
ncbi:CBS domain-containing protein [Bacillus ndiopicus]|uniref:CBS domain-containing protein n=1 Tax=Bacillus ndiopicus TaxID=1347368 RepID=UPI0005A6C9F3|nr:CBS domain-containing protein [Bacillus ndiopicus]